MRFCDHRDSRCLVARTRCNMALLVLAALASASLTGAMAQDILIDEPAAEQSEPATDKEVGFTQLSGDDAKSKWRGYNSEEWPEGWKLADGMLHRIGGGGDLMTKQQYGSFDMRLQWKIEPGGNSGVLYHVLTGDPAPYLTGLEYQVLDNERHADGRSPLTSAAALYALYPPDPNPVKPAGQWNTGRIVVQGKHVQHFLNGKKVVDCVIGSEDWNKRLAKSKFANWEKFAKADKGYITLQDHGNHVWFKNVRIKPLADEAAAE
ncbi:MAG: hypothetical protein CMJ58_17195 [Planctomycetaceae bacterium]|nr:hypothetical protein [Planctomycetaceae bacterium]